MGLAEEMIYAPLVPFDTGDGPMQGLPSCEIVQIDTSQDLAARKHKLLETVGKPELLDKEQVPFPQKGSFPSTTRPSALRRKCACPPLHSIPVSMSFQIIGVESTLWGCSIKQLTGSYLSSSAKGHYCLYRTEGLIR